MTRRRLLVHGMIVVAGAFASGPAALAARDFPDDATLEAMIRTRVEAGGATGIVVGVLEANGDRRFAAYGDPGPEAPARSYAHPGVTIPARGGREITLLDLATHRSSLPRLPTNLNPADPGNPRATVEVAPAILQRYVALVLHQGGVDRTLRRVP